MHDAKARKERQVLVPTLMPPSLIEAVDTAVTDLHYVSRAEFQRDALREKVARTHPHLLEQVVTEQEAA